MSTNTKAARHAAELDRIGALLHVSPGSRWLKGADVVTSEPDADFVADIADAVGDESTDEMFDPWSRQSPNRYRQSDTRALRTATGIALDTTIPVTGS